jgi:hypothetical protein
MLFHLFSSSFGLSSTFESSSLVFFILHPQSSSIFILYLQNINIVFVEVHIKKLPSTKIHGSPAIVSIRFSRKLFLIHGSTTILQSQTFSLPLIIIIIIIIWVFFGLPITTLGFFWVTLNHYILWVLHWFTLNHYNSQVVLAYHKPFITSSGF